MAATHLVTLSGGIDSTYALWRTLEEGHRCMVIHCKLVTRAGRYNHELAAARAVVGWLRRNGLGNFSYHETGFDYGGLPCLADIETLSYFRGAALRHHPSLTTVVLGTNAEDLTQGERWERRSVTHRHLIEYIAGRVPEYVAPARDLTKAEIIQALPAGLYNQTWSCRQPRRGVACGRCRPCRHIAEAGSRGTG